MLMMMMTTTSTSKLLVWCLLVAAAATGANQRRHKNNHNKLRSGKHHHATAFTSGSQQAHDRSSFTSIVPEEEPSLASAPGDRVVFSGGHVDFDQPPPPPDPPTTTTTTTNNSAGKSGKGRAAQAYIKWQKPTAAPVAANCSSCASHEQLVRVRLGMIKQRILSRLGYVRSLPDASYRDIPKNSPLQKLIEDFSMQSDSPAMGLRPGDANAHYDDGEGDAQIQSMYVVARTLPEEKMSASTENLNVQYFSFSKLLMKYSISDARLWIYMKADRSAEEIFDHLDTERPSRRRIPVYKVPKPPAGYEFRSESPILTQVGNVTKPYYKNNWVSLDVRSLVQDWFKDPTTNYGIIIGGPGESDSSFVVARAANVTSTHGHEEGNVPYLEIQVSEHNRRTRTKRNVGLDCDDSLRNKNLCCRHPLVVDFETIGWDWIIAPRSYHAFHCAGYCEPLHMPEYHHTIIVGQKLIVDTDINGYDPRSIYGNRPPPVACCAPKKLSALSLLHFTPDSEIIVSKVPEMITDSCTCA